MELTKQTKQAIIKLIDRKQQQLGSYAAVGIFCNVSEAVISQMRQDKYNVQGNVMHGYKLLPHWSMKRAINGI
jgi:hypothetical protein